MRERYWCPKWLRYTRSFELFNAAKQRYDGVPVSVSMSAAVLTNFLSGTSGSVKVFFFVRFFFMVEFSFIGAPVPAVVPPPALVPIH